LFKNDEVFEKLKPDAYGLSPIFVINPKRIHAYYTPLLKKKITRRIYKDDDEEIVE
jgi:hypothetical protein